MGGMDAPGRLLGRSDATCWQCGAAASAACAYTHVLVADSRDKRDALGHAVRRGRWQDRAKIRVPRCPACQSRGRVGIAIVLASTVAGAIICSILMALAHAHLEPPGAVLAGEEGVAGYPAGVGAVLGFLAGLAVAILRRRQAGLKALNAYPPIILMKQEGWQEDRQVLT